MDYKTQIKNYKQQAQEQFEAHLTKTGNGYVEQLDDSKKKVSKLYIEYQEDVKKLVALQIESDNQSLKRISADSLASYSNLNDAQQEQLTAKLVANHRKVLAELAATYDQIAKGERELIKQKMIEELEDADLVGGRPTKDLFADKVAMVNLNFVIITGLMIAIVIVIFMTQV